MILKESKHYGLDFIWYTNPGNLAKDRIRQAIKFDVKNQQNIDDYVHYGIGKAELFIIYVFIAIVLLLGGIFTRYFLVE